MPADAGDRSAGLKGATPAGVKSIAPPAVPGPEQALPPAERYFNREMSWLAFNHRVLEEARNETYPLLERLRFLSISGSNLDEFMMVRVAGLAGQVRRGIDENSIDGLTPSQQLQRIYAGIEQLVHRQHEVLTGLTRLLDDAGIRLIGNRKLEKNEADWLGDYFDEHVMPALTPQAIDPAHPFPFIANQGTGILFSMVRASDGAQVHEMILIPPALPRFVRLPGEAACWIAIEDLVRRKASRIFPGFRIHGSGV